MRDGYYLYTKGLTVGYHGVPLIREIELCLKKGDSDPHRTQWSRENDYPAQYYPADGASFGDCLSGRKSACVYNRQGTVQEAVGGADRAGTSGADDL